ncbi:MAG: flavodoxin [Gammaproteobacteria bacterium]|nr:flavodoxin [Gammaproteobacteria bacterium]
MAKIGIFFGTDSGTTRLIAKKIARKLGSDVCDMPLNINRTTLADMLKYDALILGTPTYGEGQVPGRSTGAENGSWAEFFPQLAAADLSTKRIAIYGLGDQEKYPSRFVDALFELYLQVKNRGAIVVGGWPTEGYQFAHSKANINGQFVGLALDQSTQSLLTDARLDSWLDMIKPALLESA